MESTTKKDNSRIKKFANELLSDDFRVAMKTLLASDYNLAIMHVLKDKKEGMAFSKLKDALNTNKEELNSHLKELSLNGLIVHYYKNSVFDEKYSYYEISNLGRRFTDHISNINAEFKAGIIGFIAAKQKNQGNYKDFIRNKKEDADKHISNSK